MTPVHAFPTLDQIADDPTRVLHLPRPILSALAARALTAHAATVTALLAAPVETPTPVEERLIDTKELAQRMGVSANYIYDHRGEWPFTIRRPGARTMFSLRGFEAWVAEQDGRAVPSPRAQARKGA